MKFNTLHSINIKYLNHRKCREYELYPNKCNNNDYLIQSVCCKVLNIDNELIVIFCISIILTFITSIILSLFFFCSNKSFQYSKYKHNPSDKEEAMSLIKHINNNKLKTTANISPNNSHYNYISLFSLNISVFTIFLTICKNVEYAHIECSSLYFIPSYIHIEYFAIGAMNVFALFFFGNYFAFYIKDLLLLFSIITVTYVNMFLYDVFNSSRIAILSYCIILFALVFVKFIYSNYVYSNYSVNTSLNLSEHILESYITSIQNNDDSNLYNETNRIMELCKLYEIIQKLRINRKHTLNVGLTILFVFLLLIISFNVCIYINNEKIINKIFDFNMIFQKETTEDENIKANIFEQKEIDNVLLIILDNIENDLNIKNFLNNNVIEIKVNKIENVISFINGIVSGVKREINDVIREQMNSQNYRNFDTLLNGINNKERNLFVIGNEYNKFIINNYNSYTIADFETNDSDETKFQYYMNNSQKSNYTRLSFLLLDDVITDNKSILTKLKYVNIISSKENNTLIIIAPLNYNSLYIIPQKNVIINTKISNVYDISDIGTTIIPLLQLKTIPSQNQGHFITELLDIISYSWKNNYSIRNYYFLKLRNQLREFYIQILKYLSKISFLNITSNTVNELATFVRHNGSTFLYENDISQIERISKFAINTVISKDVFKNMLYSIIISVFILITLIVFIQYFTYVHILAIFSINKYGNFNIIAFITCIFIYVLYHILTYYMLNYLNLSVLVQFTICITIAISIRRLFFFFMFSSINFYKFNLFQNKYAFIYSNNSMIYIYLTKVYNVLIAILITLFYFIRNSPFHCFFSNKNLGSFILFHNNINARKLEILNVHTFILIVYQMIICVDLLSMPKWSKYKTIYDTVFMLKDLKQNSFEDDYYEIQNYEKKRIAFEIEAFSSKFITIYTNYDEQSEMFWKRVSSYKLIKFNDKTIALLILNMFLNSENNLIEIENDNSALEILKLNNNILHNINLINSSNDMSYDILQAMFRFQYKNNN